MGQPGERWYQPRSFQLYLFVRHCLHVFSGRVGPRRLFLFLRESDSQLRVISLNGLQAT